MRAQRLNPLVGECIDSIEAQPLDEGERRAVPDDSDFYFGRMPSDEDELVFQRFTHAGIAYYVAIFPEDTDD
jgi:hypothetical protein